MKMIKICVKCNTEKSFTKYGKYYHSWCVDCRRIAQQAKRRASGIKPKVIPITTDDEKECLRCKKILNKEFFHHNSRGRLKRACYCKACYSDYNTELRNTDINLYRNKTKISTRKYRDEHREHWRTLHRLNQFNRKNLIKAQSDGTVTEEFMRNLYSIDTCYWCKEIIPISDRTAEHIIPLSIGGIHGVSNLTMACFSCNSSKLNFKNEK